MACAHASIYAYPRGNDRSRRFLSVEFLAQWYTRSPTQSPCFSLNLSVAHSQLQDKGVGQEPLKVLVISSMHVRRHLSFDCVFTGVIHRICKVIQIRDNNSDINALSNERNLQNCKLDKTLLYIDQSHNLITC